MNNRLADIINEWTNERDSQGNLLIKGHVNIDKLVAAIEREMCFREHNRTPAGMCVYCGAPKPNGGCEVKDILGIILMNVKDELFDAVGRFGPFKNAHEGYAVLLEEVDELWDAVKLNQHNLSRDEQLRKEAIQVAAMAIRFVHDVCDKPTATEEES
jgi:hypothetical protein